MADRVAPQEVVAIEVECVDPVCPWRYKEPKCIGEVGVYFIRCGRYVKIGIAADVQKRLKALQNANPFDLEVIGFLPCPDYSHARHLERNIHHQFSSLRHRLEWFNDDWSIREWLHERSAS